MSSARKYAAVLLLAVAALAVVAVFLWKKGERHEIVAALPVVPRRELIMQDKLWYKQTETNAFTGLMVDTFPNGALMNRSVISNGLPNGLSETWYTNGQMEVRENFHDGVSDGLREKWFANGRKLSEAVIVDGKVTGTFRSWHENGKLAEEIQMKQGQADGTAWAYYPSGFAKAEIAMQDGKVLNRKTWKDGEHKSTQ